MRPENRAARPAVFPGVVPPTNGTVLRQVEPDDGSSHLASQTRERHTWPVGYRGVSASKDHDAVPLGSGQIGWRECPPSAAMGWSL